MPLITAHAGHWIVDALTLVPVALIAVWFLGLAIRERRRDDRQDTEA
jgi:hypothetical protein